MTRKSIFLFVDDDVRIVNALRNILFDKADDWDFVFALSTDEALRVLASTEVDVLIVDMKMPIRPGCDLILEVAKIYPQIVILVLSGQADMTDRDKIAGSIFRYLDKPCSEEGLISAMEDALRSSHR